VSLILVFTVFHKNYSLNNVLSKPGRF